MTDKADKAESRSYADKIGDRVKDLETELEDVFDAAESRMEDGKPESKKQRAERRATTKRLEEEISDLRDDQKRAEARAERRAKAEKARADVAAETGGGAAVVRAEPRQYDPQMFGGITPKSFLSDLYASCFPGGYVPQPGETGDPQARMARHLSEFERDGVDLPAELRGTPVPRHFFDSAQLRQTLTTNIGGPAGGLVPEQYPGIVGRHLYAGAPFLALCSRYDIPTMGMQLSIPRFTAGPAAAAAAETTNPVADSAVTAANVTLPVVTAASRARVTRALIERGNMADDYILDMMGQALKTQIDAKCIKSASNPTGFIDSTRSTNHNIDQNASTKTAAKVWQSLGLGIDKIARARYMAPDAICVHQRRATYLGFALDAQGRPLFQESAATAQNVLGIGRAAPMDAQMPEMVMRLAAGQSLFVDNNIPLNQDTDQDSALVFRRGDQHCWGQSSPFMLNFEQTAGTTLEVDLIGYEYFAFSSEVQPEGGTNVRGSLFSTSLTVDTT